MAGSVSRAIDHWVEWTFRTIFMLLIALICWQGQRIYTILDRHDRDIQEMRVDFASQQSKVDTQMLSLREALLDIKTTLINLDRKLDKQREP